MTDPTKAKIIELAFPALGREKIKNLYSYSMNLQETLRAIRAEHSNNLPPETAALFWYTAGTGAVPAQSYIWNLTTDYDGQTQEVKDFIGSLIGV